MGVLSAIFKNMVYSLFVTALLSLVALSLFVGNFPPTVKQIKGVWAQYQSLMQLKEKFLAQNPQISTEDLPTLLQNERGARLKKLKETLRENSQAGPVGSLNSYYEDIEKLGQESPQDGNTRQNTRTEESINRAVASTSYGEKHVASVAELQEQLYEMRAEILRLNHRLVELERKPESAQSNPQSR